MPLLARLAETTHLLILGVWLGCLVMGAVVAAILFPTMRELDPTFTLFSNYAGNHADLGAGFIQARVFFAVDVVQFVGVLGGTITLLASIALRKAWARPMTMIRSVIFACAVLMFAYQFFVLSPRMDRNARAYWSAAADGDTPAAEQAYEVFYADHPASTRTFGFIGFFVLSTMLVGTWSVLPTPQASTQDSL